VLKMVILLYITCLLFAATKLIFGRRIYFEVRTHPSVEEISSYLLHIVFAADMADISCNVLASVSTHKCHALLINNDVLERNQIDSVNAIHIVGARFSRYG